MCGKHFWENILVRMAYFSTLCHVPSASLHLQQLFIYLFICFIWHKAALRNVHFAFILYKIIQENNDILEQKPSFVRRFRLVFKEKRRPAPHSESICITRISLIFPGRSHLTRLPGGNGDLRVSCNMRTDASAVVCAGRKGGEGWGLVFCRWRYGCVCADGVLQLFLCQSVKALHHAVCCQTSLRVLIPALCYSRTQELHALKHQTELCDYEQKCQ